MNDPDPAAPAGGRCAAACLDRRSVLRSAALAGGAVTLAACGGSSNGSSNGSESSGPTTLGPVGEVPVGGGAVFPDANVVVAQPSDGSYVAYSATCTHQGCQVGEVVDGEIVCPCHGSHFATEDGAAVTGPATEPLPSAGQIRVESGKLVLT